MAPIGLAARGSTPARAHHPPDPRRCRWAATLAALLMLGCVAGCANKAKVIQVGAKQFEAEALASIDRIDEMRHREVAAPAITPAEADRQFADLVLGSQRPIDANTLEFLLDPNDIGPLQNEPEWQRFLARLRSQYRQFAAIFSNLDQGALLAAPKVKDAIPLLDPLIGQMSAFADIMTKAPVEFVGQRTALAARIEDVRMSGRTETQKRQALAQLRRELVELAAAETQMNEAVIAQCLKTATLGRQLRGLIQDYDKLSVDAIADGLQEAFAFANSLPGVDLQNLQGQTTELLDEINQDPELKTALDRALARTRALRGD